MKRNWLLSSISSPMLRVPVALSLTFLLLTVSASPQDTDPEALKERARDILSDSSYQKELEDPEADWYEGRIQHGGTRTEDGVFSQLLKMLLIIGLVVLVGLTVLWIGSSVQDRKRRSHGSGPAPDPTKEGLFDEFTLDHVEEAARAGRYDEAVHLLLLLAVKRLSARQKVSTPWNLTSRELLRVLPKSEEERSLFKKLVATVELSLFGGRPVSEDGYKANRGHYEGLAK